MSGLRDFFARKDRLVVGDAAPAVEAVDQDGAPVRLGAAYAQGPVLLFFYVRAGTPVCTMHACRYRDRLDELREPGLQIFGVSGDPPERLRRFREKRRLPYRLLADVEGKIAEAFRVRSFFGFPERRAFLIREGRIAWEGRAGEVSELAASFEELRS